MAEQMQSCMDEDVLAEVHMQRILLSRRLQSLAERIALQDKSYITLDQTQYIDIKMEHVAEAVKTVHDALDMWSVPVVPIPTPGK